MFFHANRPKNTERGAIWKVILEDHAIVFKKGEGEKNIG